MTILQFISTTHAECQQFVKSALGAFAKESLH